MASLSKNGTEVARMQKVEHKTSFNGVPETKTITLSIRSNNQVLTKWKVEWEGPNPFTGKRENPIESGWRRYLGWDTFLQGWPNITTEEILTALTSRGYRRV